LRAAADEKWRPMSPLLPAARGGGTGEPLAENLAGPPGEVFLIGTERDRLS